ncbi:MAG: signal peptidase I [Candidatus Pacearchaeota archaeon]
MTRYYKKIKSLLTNFWNYIWKGDSLGSWLTFIIVTFLFIKFVFFPTISFIMGSKLPIVIVESCSMYHTYEFEEWWKKNGKWYEERNISKQSFLNFPFVNGFSKGDIFFVVGVKKEKIRVGDIIIFYSGSKNRPIIHRVVDLDPIQTKGDNNRIQFSYYNNLENIDETNIRGEQIIGRVLPFKIPFLGWVKLIFYEPFRSKNERGFCF